MIIPRTIAYNIIIGYKNQSLYLDTGLKLHVDNITSVVVTQGSKVTQAFRNWAEKRGLRVLEPVENSRKILKNRGFIGVQEVW